MASLEAESDAVYDPLVELPYPAYLCAMRVIAEQLLIRYQADTSQAGTSAMRQTLVMVERAVAASDAGVETPEYSSVDAALEQLIDEGQDTASVGLMNTWMTFQALAGELPGEFAPYSGAQRLILATVEDYRQPPTGAFQRVGVDEEVDDEEDVVQVLRRFAAVVRLAGEQARNGDGYSPDAIRAAVFR